MLTDLHVRCVEVLLDAGALPRAEHLSDLAAESIADATTVVIAELLARRSTDLDLKIELFNFARGMRSLMSRLRNQPSG